MDSLSADLVCRIFVRPELSLSLTKKQWQQLILILRNQQLLARYSALFKQAGLFDSIPKQTQRHFLNADVLANNHKKQVLFEALELKHEVEGRQQYLIFLKGAGYSLSNSSIGQTRIYNDIDILTDKKSIDGIEKKLTLYGWQSEELTEHDEKYYRKWAHEIPPLRHGIRGTVVDIHHNIVPIISGRHIDADQFAKHSVITKDGFQILSYAAMTMHSLIHLFFNEDVKKGYRDLIDIHTLMTDHSDDEYWEELINLARESGFELELFLACRYSEKFFATKIPAKVTKHIAVNRPWNMKYLDFIYKRVLKPNHPICRPNMFGLATFLILLRGHFQKMPLHILIFHLTTKSFIGMTQALLGKHFFTKELEQDQP
ncbi:nucleotidyltransferase family protein [Paraglaciecola aquimarina]|uniref:Nucleotidyltransferase family protein n=1 Tax=Paraglaciecola aquimarina TaxID=1235557 RepID=A0ABU3T258_9ALTE|nr:nucleotidyltransferase family protein [Paraglaciecola aquimarina]MDU0356336.1 nucleotidyltransferase family protein [Paraglaciecola aquimarina]